MKHNKKQWHKSNKEIAYKLTRGKCDKCNYIGKFSIHHKSYDNIKGKSIYSFSFIELYKTGIVEVLCYKCHSETHIGDNISYCHYCGKLCKLSRSVNLKIKFPVCKKCFKQKGGAKGNFNAKTNQLDLFNQKK